MIRSHVPVLYANKHVHYISVCQRPGPAGGCDASSCLLGHKWKDDENTDMLKRCLKQYMFMGFRTFSDKTRQSFNNSVIWPSFLVVIFQSSSSSRGDFSRWTEDVWSPHCWIQHNVWWIDTDSSVRDWSADDLRLWARGITTVGEQVKSYNLANTV